MPKPKRKRNAGYDAWAEALAKRWGISRKELEQGDYDYRAYYNSDPSAAESHLQGDPNAHFPDTYKRPTHPTFSEESIYSGRNGNVVGGKWKENPEDTQRWTYQLSPGQVKSNWDVDKTIDYAGFAEDEGLRVVDDKGRYPVQDGVVEGGVLPAVNVEGNKKEEGPKNIFDLAREAK